MSKSEIQPIKNELPSHFADRLGVLYASQGTQSHKKEKGQFFTPVAISTLMASFSKKKANTLRILDPGCGTAILTCCLIEELIGEKHSVKEIEVVAYEMDEALIEFSNQALSYLKAWTNNKGVALKYTLYADDFVLTNAAHLTTKIADEDAFDIIISNPPYFKLSKEDSRVKIINPLVKGQSNIYSIFMLVAARLLKMNGELIFITPRSFSSGSYFKSFREYFFTFMQLENIHLFASRKDTFTRDSVLQETVIMKATRETQIDITNPVKVYSSQGLKDIKTPSVKIFQLQDLIDMTSQEKMLHLPINDEEEGIVNIFKRWDGSINKYNIQVSTGPVVAFRSREHIYDTYRNGTVFLTPLFWLHNIDKMILTWPIPKPDKGQYVQILPETKSILIPNKNYILLRRFSTKDDKSRLIAAPYFCNAVDAEYIGVENKVNYIYRPKGHLSRNEVVGLCALLNSELFDNYFRIFNGNVNVSATELRAMTLPPLEDIINIGEKIILSNNYSTENANQVINEHFNLTRILTV
jgi:adenine-specific DNA-methyltransferase